VIFAWLAARSARDANHYASKTVQTAREANTYVQRTAEASQLASTSMQETARIAKAEREAADRDRRAVGASLAWSKRSSGEPAKVRIRAYGAARSKTT
jgi:hypothetical protein